MHLREISEKNRQIITHLNGRSPIEVFEAAKAIWEDSDACLDRPLLWTLKNGKSGFNRAAAAFAKQIVRTPRTIVALEPAVSDKSERAPVRGEAAEALRTVIGRNHNPVLLRGLDDPSKDVRLWCAFAWARFPTKMLCLV
jgi:hypothetical protein